MKSFARLGNVSLYAEVSRNNLEQAKKINGELLKKDKEIENSENEETSGFLFHESLPLRMGLSEKATIAIVFAAMSLESYIYDYSARELGDSFVQNHIDKLDLASKYILAVQLIKNVKFPKDKSVYNLLVKLIKARNNLIHSKSKNVDFDNQQMLEDHSNSHYHLYKSAEEAIKAMDAMAEYISSIDPDEPANLFLGKKEKMY